METQLFYWTGAALWWIACGAFVLAVALFAIWLPAYLMIRTRRAAWHWIWAAKIAKYGYSQTELQYAYLLSGQCLPENVELADIVNWVGRVKEFAEKEQSELTNKK